MVDASVLSADGGCADALKSLCWTWVRDPLQREPLHSYFANALNHGLCAVGKGAHSWDASQRRGYIVYLAWFLFEPLH